MGLSCTAVTSLRKPCKQLHKSSSRTRDACFRKAPSSRESLLRFAIQKAALPCVFNATMRFFFGFTSLLMTNNNSCCCGLISSKSSYDRDKKSWTEVMEHSLNWIDWSEICFPWVFFEAARQEPKQSCGSVALWRVRFALLLIISLLLVGHVFAPTSERPNLG